MDKFDECEEKGRKIVEAILDDWGYKWEETKDKYECYDIQCTGSTGIAAIEVKYRSGYTSAQIESFKGGKGHILELHKYNDLMNLYFASGFTPIYWMVYPDKSIVWDLTTITPSIDYDTYPSTTAEQGYDKYKPIIYLNKKDSKWTKQRQETK